MHRCVFTIKGNVLITPEFDQFLLVLFLSRRLSLHDHPSMMVVSKVLCGKLERRSLDLLDRSYQEKLAKIVYIDNDYTPIGKM